MINKNLLFIEKLIEKTKNNTLLWRAKDHIFYCRRGKYNLKLKPLYSDYYNLSIVTDEDFYLYGFPFKGLDEKIKIKELYNILMEKFSYIYEFIEELINEK